MLQNLPNIPMFRENLTLPIASPNAHTRTLTPTLVLNIYHSTAAHLPKKWRFWAGGILDWGILEGSSLGYYPYNSNTE